jgi:hypothetical protein
MAGWFRLASPATWAILLGGLAALSFAAMIPLTFLSGQVFSGALPLVIGVPCAGVGILVARRQPRNPIGWLFLVTGTCLFLSTDGSDYARADQDGGRSAVDDLDPVASFFHGSGLSR